jgi:hypothetical protein
MEKTDEESQSEQKAAAVDDKSKASTPAQEVANPAKSGASQEKGPKRNRGRLIGIVAAVVAAAAICCYTFVIAPHNQAVSEFNTVASKVREKNTELQKKIDAAKADLDAGKKPLDASTRDALNAAVSNARQSMRTIPDVPLMTSEIKADTAKLSKPLDYTKDIKSLDDAKSAYEKSVQQLKQVTAPSQDFVVSRLGTISDISDIEPVNEENDVNQLLKKSGGYTAAIFFHYNNLNDPYGTYAGKSSIDNGTAGGGCVEVFGSVDDAKKRNEYLTDFDGMGAFSGGSHYLVGTVLIRTSYELTATQQNTLTREIKDALIAVK